MAVLAFLVSLALATPVAAQKVVKDTGFDGETEQTIALAKAESPELSWALDVGQQAMAFVLACQAGECPKIDCPEANQLYADLKAMEMVLDAYKGAGTQAKADAFAHIQSLGKMAITTGSNLYNAQLALAVQQYLHNLSKAIADVASLADFLKSWEQKGLGDNWGDTLEMLDTMEQRIRTLDSLTTNLARGVTGDEKIKDIYKPHATPGGEKATQDAVNTARQGTVDVLKAIRKFKKEWKDGVSAAKAAGKVFNPSMLSDAKGWLAEKEGLRKNVLGWVQKALVSYDDTLMKEREQNIKDMMGDQSAEAIAQTSAFLEYQRYVRKLETAEEASNILKQALAQMGACFEKAKCEPMSIAFDRPSIPNFGKNWGTAFQSLDKMLSALTLQIQFPAIVNDCPPPKDAQQIADGFGPFIYLGLDSTVMCTFIPTYPIPLPLAPFGYPQIYDPTPLTPSGNPSIPGFPGNPYAPGYPYGPSITDDPDQPFSPIKPIGGNPWGPYGFPQFPGIFGGPITVTPNDNPKTTEKPQDPKQPTSGPPPIYINFKATQAAMQAGQSGTVLPGEQIKIFPDSTVNPALPGTNTAKNDTGHDGEPMQGTTGGPDNSVTIPYQWAIGAGLDYTKLPKLSLGYDIDLNINPNNTGIIGYGDVGLKTGKLADKFEIGGDLYSNFYTTQGDAQSVLDMLPGLFELNWCRTKEPLAPGTDLNLKVDPRDALPSAHISLKDAR